MIKRATTLVVMIAASLQLAVAHAQDYEIPPVFSANTLLTESLVSGPNHRVDDRVQNDGFLNHYVIQSPFGELDVASTVLLRKRVHEMNVIAELEAVSETDLFTNAVTSKVEDLVAGAESIVTDPIGSVENVVSGVGKLFGRATRSLSETARSDTEDSQFEDLIGFSKAKRDYAYEFGVDVYSRNQLLQQRLNAVAWTGYTAGLSGSIALGAVSGGVGIAITATSATQLMDQVVRDSSPDDLRLLNRERLADMGVHESVIELFIGNALFTPREQTEIVAALDEMAGVESRERFITHAVLTDTADVARFRAQQARMYADYHANQTSLSRLVSVGELLFGMTTEGGLIANTPVDYLSWTESLEAIVDAADQVIAGAVAYKELRVTGYLSDRAKQALTQHGWKFAEGA